MSRAKYTGVVFVTREKATQKIQEIEKQLNERLAELRQQYDEQTAMTQEALNATLSERQTIVMQAEITAEKELARIGAELARAVRDAEIRIADEQNRASQQIAFVQTEEAKARELILAESANLRDSLDRFYIEKQQ